MDQAKLDLLVGIAGTRSIIISFFFFFLPFFSMRKKKTPDDVYEFRFEWKI
jgi:hypothetical protein